MSSIRYALERLDSAVSRLDFSVSGTEQVLQEQAYTMREQAHMIQTQQDNVIDVDFVAGRLDRAIKAVEYLLKEGE